MTELRWPDKDPTDVWDYSLDAREWIAAVGGTLSSCSATVDPAGLTIGATSVTAAGIATVRLSGGTAGTDYTITLTLNEAASRVLQRSVKMLVADL